MTNKYTYVGWSAGLLLFGIVGIFLYALQGALIPLLAAFFLSYLLFPLVKKFEKYGVKREWATLGVFLLLTVVVIVSLIFLIPPVIRDTKLFVVEIPQKISLLLMKFQDWFETHHTSWPLISQLDPQALSLDHVVDAIQAQASHLSLETIKSWSETALGAFGKTFGGFLSFVLAVMNLFLFPVFFFYVISDYEKIVFHLKSLIPKSHKPSVGPVFEKIGKQVNDVLAGYIRGQVVVCGLLSAYYAVALMIAGVPFAIPMGLISGCLNLIPFVGFSIGFALSMIVALASDFSLMSAVSIVVVFVLGQLLEGFILTPRFVGGKVGLNALVTMLAIIVWGNLMGFTGMLLAIPLTAIGKYLLQDVLEAYQNSKWFQKG